MKNLACFAIAALALSPVSAGVLVDEGFENLSGSGLPAGWAFFNPAANGRHSILEDGGHDGSAGDAGRGGEVMAVTASLGLVAGAWMQAPVVVDGGKAFDLGFDFKCTEDNDFSDCAVVFGDLSDPFGWDGSEINRFWMVVFNKNAAANDFWLVNEGARGNAPVVDDFSSGLTVGVWYRASLDWLPASNTGGSLSLEIRRVSDNSLAGDFSLAVADIGRELRFGFGSYNDTVVFDHIVLNGGSPGAGGTVDAMDDLIEVGPGGMIAFDPTRNDAAPGASIDPGSVVIESPPGSGTAVFDAQAGRIVYQHGGGAAGSDGFSYRVGASNGATGVATVRVTVSDALRIENATLTLPSDPPVPGTLQLVDAFPGLTFDGMVSMASVPGFPKRLIVGSVHGAVTGSDSKVWMIPDTTSPAPVKKELFAVDSLTNFRRGRGIYSVVCKPDFATSGELIVCYQGSPAYEADTRRHDDLPPVGTIANLGDGPPHYQNQVGCTLRISRFTITPAQLQTLLVSRNQAETDAVRAVILASELRYLNLAEQALYHSINDCHFGPDGYLYVSFGDEGEQGDTFRNGQRIDKDTFSSLIRIDIDKQAGNAEPNAHYSIPVNPATALRIFRCPWTTPLCIRRWEARGTRCSTAKTIPRRSAR